MSGRDRPRHGQHADPFAGLALQGSWRPAQRAALDAFEADRAADRDTTYVVAPPGSGKTVLGLEIARRLGRPTLVLAPTTTIAGQWQTQPARFGADDAILAERGGPLHLLTYQALCRTTDPGGALRDAALRDLAAERATATGVTVDVALAEMARFAGAARTRLERDVAARVAARKREIARGEHPDADLRDLLAPEVRERIDALRAAGVGTVVLDECHHVASLWGYLVRTVVAALREPRPVHVVGLTATPPRDLSADEATLVDGLLGPIDVEVPVPAVVRDGHLAPFQELAFFVEPLAGERGWLDERHVRFAELLDDLHAVGGPDEEEIAFGPWIIGRLRHRDTGDGRARVPFATLLARRPDLARAGLRWLHAGGLDLPDDAPHGEGFREPPTLEDWLALISDYAVGCLRAHPSDAAERRFDALRTGLRDLGFALTRQGLRRGGSDVDRVLVESAAKPLGAIEVLGREAEARGDDLRAVVLCDTEGPGARAARSPLTGGGTRGVLAAFADDLRTQALRPLMVTGRTVACLRRDADVLAAALGADDVVPAHGRVDAPAGTSTASGAGASGSTAPSPVDPGAEVVLLRRAGWDSRAWVHAAGRALADGTTRVVVGTRGLLAEGWDAPRLNVVVDLTTVAADVSVRQLRGRALRLDPGDPDKVASNWDVVCLASDLARGTADYERFVRRHGHLHAPCEDGSIETGVSHVHPLLSPYAPPPTDAFAELNAHALERSADRLGARDRWRIGEPYVGEDLPVLLVRPTGGATRGTGSVDAGSVADRPDVPPPLPSPHGPGLAFALRAAVRAYPPVLPLDRVAAAIVAAYVELDEISPRAAASLVLTPRPGGTVRCALPDGSAAENARFSAALDEAIGPAAGHRYVLSRPVVDPTLGPAGTLAARVRARWRTLTGRTVADVAWHPVPTDLGSHKRRAEAFAAAWATWLGPGELLFAGREGAAGRDALAIASAAAAAWTGSRRTLWH
ncbi:MAG: DEAD/DEAH box helicase family protein [Solirubrobacteraceae bacterium]|nr:DEAD/DEAH box helicase family protein [Solirubrobacteraceae bacterium]